MRTKLPLSTADALPSEVLQRIVGGAGRDDKRSIDSDMAIGMTAGADEAGHGTPPANGGKPTDIKPPTGNDSTGDDSKSVDELRKNAGDGKVSKTIGSTEKFKIEIENSVTLNLHTGELTRDTKTEVRSSHQDSLEKKAAGEKGREDQKSHDQAVQHYEQQKIAHDAAQQAVKHAEDTHTATRNDLDKANKDLSTRGEQLAKHHEAVGAAEKAFKEAAAKAELAEAKVNYAIKFKTADRVEVEQQRVAALTTKLVAEKAYHDQKVATEKADLEHKAAAQQVEAKTKALDKAHQDLEKAKQALANPPGQPPVKPAAPAEKPAEPKKSVSGQMLDDLKKNATKTVGESINNIGKGLSKEDAKTRNAYTKDDTRQVLAGGVKTETHVDGNKETEITDVNQVVLESQHTHWASPQYGSGTEDSRKLIAETGHVTKVTTTDADGTRHQTIDRQHASWTGSVSGNSFSGGSTPIDIAGGIGVAGDAEDSKTEKTIAPDGRETVDTSYGHYHGETGLDGGFHIGADGASGKIRGYFEHIVEKGKSHQGTIGDGRYKLDGKVVAQWKGEIGTGFDIVPDLPHGKIKAGGEFGGQIDLGVAAKGGWSLISGLGNGIQVENEVMVGSVGGKLKPTLDYDNGKLVLTMAGSFSDGLGFGSKVKLTADVNAYKEGFNTSWQLFKGSPSDTYNSLKEEVGSPVLAGGLSVAAKIPLIALVSGSVNALMGAFR